MPSESTELMKRLVKEASQVRFIPSATLTTHYRFANSLLTQAKHYKKENDLINAYKFYRRYVTLVLEKLPEHPEYGNPEHKLEKQELVKNANLALIEMQNMEPILDSYFRRVEAGEALKKEQATSCLNVPKTSEHYKRKQQIQKQDQGDQDQECFNISRNIENIYQHETTHNEIYKSYPTNWGLVNESKDIVPSSYSTDSSLSVSDQKPHHNSHIRYEHYDTNQNDGYIYPASTFDNAPPLIPPKIKDSPPKLPPKPNEYLYDASPSHSPRRSSKISISKSRNEHSSYKDLSKTSISKSRNEHSSYEVLSKIPNVPEYFAFTESGEGLRTIIMPINIRDKFIQISAPNTAKNLETCGVLLIPKQISTSDSCTMTNEEELLKYVERNGLLTLGWIHTHPTQTCFMSSMDLHTHSVYQVILPEAVAIVCAPSKSPNFGIFRLTNPPGLQTILQCVRRGFHPHNSNEKIDKEISSYGHVVMEKIDLTVVDLRRINKKF
ncbi:23711_t:CDS:10 [Entrophospora sp. SA101]|nr:15319_t:CDS:10 [Entrophospora sp. SA101]CAJ0757124.1 23711_t:CDS:10 [Entrophospora sp. SA101]CAJ0840034.1 10388_t:CDS:10 [Entrophospora sp. SA101]CAJ0844480.1 14203_t:CDS:10 [Entrophospora sp. SA101]CAJ0901943.1 2139_t:CDS:10 [Entrophospora sp. SA101]